jgi:hypothetical protein
VNKLNEIVELTVMFKETFGLNDAWIADKLDTDMKTVKSFLRGKDRLPIYTEIALIWIAGLQEQAMSRATYTTEREYAHVGEIVKRFSESDYDKTKLTLFMKSAQKFKDCEF